MAGMRVQHDKKTDGVTVDLEKKMAGMRVEHDKKSDGVIVYHEKEG